MTVGGSELGRFDRVVLAAPPAIEPAGPGVMGAPVEGVYDVLKVPADLPAGEYVLGWRYDCEATAQVWSNCADVTLEA